MPWLLRMTLFAAGIAAVIDLYLGWRLTKGISYLAGRRGSMWSRATVVLFLVFFSLPLYGLIQYGTGGSVDIFTYPRSIMYLFWFGFVFSFQLLTWVIILDLLKLSVNVGAGLDDVLINRLYGFTLLTVSVVVLTYSGLKLHRDTTRITTDRTEAGIAELPESLEGFRVVHISDIQGDAYTGPDKIERYIQRVNDLNPDLVVFTGDLISYGTDYVKMAARKMAGINAEYGTYAVIGDHDYWAGTDAIEEALVSNGITVLEGENEWIDTDGGTVRLSGVTHVYSRRAPRSEVLRVTRDTLDASVTIFATHQVSDLILDRVRTQGYHLLLAGHTHGGQLRVPYFFQTVSAPGFETDYVRGQYHVGELLISVNSGLGYTLAPVRYNAPAEVTLIELRRDR